jgi:hypothetical protein
MGHSDVIETDGKNTYDTYAPGGFLGMVWLMMRGFFWARRWAFRRRSRTGSTVLK